jgi:hypothetical protein
MSFIKNKPLSADRNRYLDQAIENKKVEIDANEKVLNEKQYKKLHFFVIGIFIKYLPLSGSGTL